MNRRSLFLVAIVAVFSVTIFGFFLLPTETVAVWSGEKDRWKKKEVNALSKMSVSRPYKTLSDEHEVTWEIVGGEDDVSVTAEFSPKKELDEPPSESSSFGGKFFSAISELFEWLNLENLGKGV